MRPRFRAWLKKKKKMVATDDLVNISFEDEEICVQTLYFEEGLISERDLDYYEFDEIELMQTTGILDKNSQEIFEGDILEIQGIRMVVKFGSYKYIESSKGNGHTFGMVYDGLGFYVECINAADPDRISPFEPETLKESTIIGNRFENPELLEDGK